MKVSFFKSRIVPIGTAFVCVLTLFTYQNCSKDVGFDSRPSTDRSNVDGQGTNNTNPSGPITGGNSNVIIQLNETPTDTTRDNGDSVVDFEVSAPNGNITDVTCTLDGVVVSCNPIDRIPITNLDLGEHVFVITGTNNNGDTGSETITWVIYNTIVEVTKDIAVTTVGDKVDIIINVDNSGSMEYEHQSMQSRVASFMTKFQHLDYNISITTTSPIGGVWHAGLNYVDGQFIQLSDGSYCIRKSAHTNAQAQSFIENNVVRDNELNSNGTLYPEGNGWERGIFTTYRAFERANTNGSPESGCLRANVPKHVILISDERETMTDNNGNDLNEVSKSIGSNLVSYVSQVFGSNTVFKFHSIIVNPYSSEGASCLASHGRRSGVEYANLSLATGGVIGSVCAADYASQLGEIGQTISDSNLSYPLSCVAVSNNGDMGGVTDLGNNQAVSGFTFSGDKVEFDQLLPQGNYRIRYFCYQ